MEMKKYKGETGLSQQGIVISKINKIKSKGGSILQTLNAC